MMKKLCYELYKIDWKKSHGITEKQEMDVVKGYFETQMSPDADEDYLFEEYLEDVGYGGELYVCFDEFVESEYADKKYIKTLLDNHHLYNLYLADCADSE